MQRVMNNNVGSRRAASAVACAFAICLAMVGCSTSPGGGIPRGAVLVTETPDFKAGFTAPEDGTIYIYHRSADSYGKGFLRYSGPIMKGTVFTIDPETNAATVDGKPLEVTVPGGGNHYQVYFRGKSAEPIDGMR